jgi:predicted phosphodiesterase
MKIVCTCDLHYDNPKSRTPAERLARRICTHHADADVLVLAGDLCGYDLSILADCLLLFEEFGGRKLMVAGNHDLWTFREDSFDRYARRIPRTAADCGFECLDDRPAVAGDVGFAGTVGWYDYSFRRDALGMPMRFYLAKTGPVAARVMGEYRHLVERTDDIGPDARDVAVHWKDGSAVRLGRSDAEFTGHCCRRLAEHLAEIAPAVRTVVGVSHHVPFAQVCPDEPLSRKIPQPAWQFTNAFMGSERLGETFGAEPKVRTILFGHTHAPYRGAVNGIELINPGSTYTHKELVVLNV